MRVSHLTVSAVLCAATVAALGTPVWAASAQSSGAQPPPTTQGGGGGQSQDAQTVVVQLYQQVNTLEQQVRDLRGRDQELAHEIQTLRNRQRQLYMSTDQRLQALEAAVSGGHGGALATNASGVAPGSVTVPAGSGTTSAAQGVTPAPNSTGTTGGAGQQTSAASGTFTNGKDLAAYEKAFNLLKNSHYQEAIDAFRRFEKTYPKSPYVANAEYWTGEALYVEQQFAQALAQFQKVVNNYPQSNKVSASMLKIGYSQYELKRWAAARTTLQNVVSQFPGTTAARLAADRLSRMKREGH